MKYIKYCRLLITVPIVFFAFLLIGCGEDFLEEGYLVAFPFQQYKRYDFKEPKSNFYDFIRIIYINDEELEEMVTTTDVKFYTLLYKKELKMAKYIQWMENFRKTEAYQKAKEYDKVLVHYWICTPWVSGNIEIKDADGHLPIVRRNVYPRLWVEGNSKNDTNFGYNDGYKSYKLIFERVEILLFEKGKLPLVEFSVDIKYNMGSQNNPIATYNVSQVITFNRPENGLNNKLLGGK